MRNHRSEQGNVNNMVKLLPNFNERDPEIFFSLFEHVATERGWGVSDQVILLQTVLTGKGQEAFIALSPSERR